MYIYPFGNLWFDMFTPFAFIVIIDMFGLRSTFLSSFALTAFSAPAFFFLYSNVTKFTAWNHFLKVWCNGVKYIHVVVQFPQLFHLAKLKLCIHWTTFHFHLHPASGIILSAVSMSLTIPDNAHLSEIIPICLLRLSSFV